MTTALVSIPVSRDELADALANGLPGPRVGFAATRALLETFGLASDAEEDGEYAALLIASVVALAAHGERLVVTAEASLVRGDVEADVMANGGVMVGDVARAAIVSWFSDVDPQAGAAAAAVVKGLDIESAWATPEVSALLADHDLAWHAPIETPIRQD